ncbi:hypothetical protein MN116_001563 [Schistosoma mekongi]|uniref:DUF4476 domain-containing protein n=1 Tax=Schistosoma mekongi TaxID=38744 RepID=A0AAE1ZJB4_SCHME|nr:hypothetical protein MN116_001563 [Schistosoma mekongi]
MAKIPLSDAEFERLKISLISESTSVSNKYDKLYYSKGYLTGMQAAAILGCYNTAPERVKVIKALQKRLCRMTCAEASEILNALQSTNYDRLFALDCIKHTLVDHETTEGTEYILKAFVYEIDKLKALQILSTVSMHVKKELPSGGHQVYAPFGGLYSQCFPGRETLYGPICEQMALKDHLVKPSLPVTVNINPTSSLFHSSPSYKYSGDLDRSWYLGGGKPPLPPTITDYVKSGPPMQLNANESNFCESSLTLQNNNTNNNTNNVSLTLNQVEPKTNNSLCVCRQPETNCCV